ncbi:hypothetical protein GCM10022419_039360 [Nonomuraea rosea]|uniref:HTH tetR-type domain-containing protein n=1 Tax=Nonomuraea rosea TaxID=638574 RepID=A0ABP6WRD7_9ACTN
MLGHDGLDPGAHRLHPPDRELTGHQLPVQSVLGPVHPAVRGLGPGLAERLLGGGEHGGETRAGPVGAGMRADARRNRDQILAAARKIYLAEGFTVPMEEIARAAGVGVGTLYRSFPDRDALIRGLAIDAIQRVTALGEIAWAEEPDAWSALRRFVHEGGEPNRVVSAVRPHLIDAVPDDEELFEAGVAWFELLSRMVVAAQEAGDMRTDVAPGDVLLILNLLTRPMPGLPADLARRLPDRFFDVMFDGLRAGSSTQLSGAPIARWWT